MADSTFQDRYQDLLKQYILDSNEESLKKALDLGMEMLDDQIDPEAIIEIHQEAMKELESRMPSESFPPSADISYAPLKAIFSLIFPGAGVDQDVGALGGNPHVVAFPEGRAGFPQMQQFAVHGQHLGLGLGPVHGLTAG